MPRPPPFFSDCLHQAIAQIYSGIADPSQAAAAFDNAARLCGAKGVLIGPLIEQAAPVPGLVAYASEVFHEAIPAYLSDFLPINPRKNWLVQNRVKDAIFSDDDVLSVEEINAHPFYNDFLRKHGNMRSCDRVSSGAIDGSSLWISAQFGIRSGVPDQEQREVFRVLSGHIAQAIGVSRLLHQNRERTLSVDALANAYSCAALIVDRNASIVAMNDRARALHGRGLSFRGGQVAATSSRDSSAFLRFLRDAMAPTMPFDGPCLMRLASPIDSLTLLLRASPLPLLDQPMPILDVINRRGWILILAETLGGSEGRSIDRPLILLGLTPAEARVAALVGAGFSPDEASERLGIAVSTARLHLRRAYEKLGVNRQTGLARIVARLEMLVNGSP